MIVIKNIKNIAFSALFTAVMAVLSLIYIPLTIPITLQTLAVFLSLLILGAKWGSISVLTYILLGVVGLPVFSGFKSGIAALLSPTGGYVIGLLVICLTYLLFNCFFKGRFKNLGLIIGLILCYLIGSVWYMLFSGEESFLAVVTVCVLPFLVPDTIKLIIANLIAKKVKYFSK